MMDEHHRDSDLDDSMSHNDLSDADPDLGDADSVDGDSHHISLQKIQDEDRVDRHSLPDAHRLSAASMVPPPPFSLPMPYPFSHPAYLPPTNAFPPNPPVHRTSSEGSHSSESSNSSQQTWSYEEQYKQVRQLYELSEEPKRKEFLDDLFSFNQKKGTPINRLPIMAKSVLDLYELYNHVVQRGGLVEVINKKLWQEIIKGLNLPSSITSAAFTLRTQYMKYLYPYECHKLNLSSNSELQAAIDGNRRDQRDRRVSCSVSYSQLHGAGGVPTNSFGLTSPLRSVSSSSPHSRNHLNGGFHHSANNNNNTINPYLSPALAGMIPGLHPGLTSAELETRMAEYLHILNKQLRLQPAVSPPDDRPGSHATSPVGGITGDSTPGPDLPSRLALWNNLYHSPPPHAPPTSLPPQSPLVTLPPQREALNLGKRESDGSPPAPPAKRTHTEKKANGGAVIKQEPAEPRVEPNNNKMGGLSVNTGARENSIVVSIDIGGIQYQGVLFAQSLADKSQHAPVSMST